MRESKGDEIVGGIVDLASDRTFEGIHSTAPMPLVPWVLGNLDLTRTRSVFDLGCGIGRFALPVASLIAPNDGEVHGIDLDPRAVEEFNRRAHNAGLRAEATQGNILAKAAIPNARFDMVMLNFVLHTLSFPRIKQFLGTVSALVAPDGQLLVTAYGENHISEPTTWLTEALISAGLNQPEARRVTRQLDRPRRFSIDDGTRLLRRHFDHLEFTQFRDVFELSPYDLEDMVGPRLLHAPRLSTHLPDGVDPRNVAATFREIMASHSNNGHVELNADIAMFVARSPRRGPWPWI